MNRRVYLIIGALSFSIFVASLVSITEIIYYVVTEKIAFSWKLLLLNTLFAVLAYTGYRITRYTEDKY